MPKITTKGIISRLEITANLSKEDAERFLLALSDIILNELIKGNAVMLPKIGIIKPIVVPNKTMQVMGVPTKVEEQLKLKLDISKTLKEYYKTEISEKGKLSTSIKSVGNLFSKK